MISIHALREEGDVAADVVILYRNRFLSTPSARRATLLSGYGRVRDDISIHALREEGDGAQLQPLQGHTHFYPRPPRGGRHGTKAWFYTVADFYPRPPRGGRLVPRCRCDSCLVISIHALREEGDFRYAVRCVKSEQFLSTPSARRATKYDTPFNRETQISIHALREEGDV